MQEETLWSINWVCAVHEANFDTTVEIYTVECTEKNFILIPPVLVVWGLAE
jgi:hypothetical protein